MSANVILPVSQAVWDEIAASVTARGQPDRVFGRHIDLSDVALQSPTPEKSLHAAICSRCKGKGRYKGWNCKACDGTGKTS
jgi:DnaJ-class molecular chaperone